MLVSFFMSCLVLVFDITIRYIFSTICAHLAVLFFSELPSCRYLILSKMHFSKVLSSVVLAGLATALPQGYSAPTADGFPKPSASQLAAIQVVADGQLSNAPPPAKVAASSLTAFQLIAFNENFEVAYFSSLIQNITDGVAGFKLKDPEKKQVLDVLTTVKAVSSPSVIRPI